MTTVSFAANHGEIGGGEVMLLAMAEATRESGRGVRVVAPAGELLDAAAQRGFATVKIHADSTASYLAGLRRWASDTRPELLWCNGLRPAFATALMPRRVVHLHQPPEGAQRLLAATAAIRARLVVVPSEYMKAQVGLGSVVLENWTEPFESAPHPLPINSMPVRLGYLGRISPDKGVNVLAHALDLLAKDFPGKFHLLLAGEPRFVSPEAQALVERRLAAVTHLTERKGWISRRDFFDSVDLAVFPSVWDEPFGLVAAEAMSAGCPFVVSDSGALPSIVGEEFPWIARPGDAADLARCIAEAINGYTAQHLRRAYERWATHYSPEAGRARLDALLNMMGPT